MDAHLGAGLYRSSYGVYAGAVPENPRIVALAGLHLLAMNLLYPKVVGRHVHLNPLAVTLSLMFWTLMWGSTGLILAVPITAAIKAVCENIESLQPVANLLGD